jgi:hypothetical protein
MTRARDFADVISGQFDIPVGSLDNAVVGDGDITTAKLADSAVTDAKISGVSSSKLTGAMPAIDGSSLTGINSGFTFPTAQALNNQSSVDFTGIPSGTNIIKFALHRASGSLTGGVPAIQLGDSGGIETSGYAFQDTFIGLSASSMYGGSSNTASSWNLSNWTGASHILTVCGEIFRVYSNNWFLQAAILQNDGDPNYLVNLRGMKTLSAELTQIRFTVLSGNYDDANSYVRIGYQ